MQVLSKVIPNIILKTRILTSLVIKPIYAIDYKIYKIILSD